jgi:hypothetical protein
MTMIRKSDSVNKNISIVNKRIYWRIIMVYIPNLHTKKSQISLVCRYKSTLSKGATKPSQKKLTSALAFLCYCKMLLKIVFYLQNMWLEQRQIPQRS